MQPPYDHATDEYQPDAPTHRGRLAMLNLLDLLESLANDDDLVGDWVDAVVWAQEYQRDLVEA
jgi:hypothetical protein